MHDCLQNETQTEENRGIMKFSEFLTLTEKKSDEIQQCRITLDSRRQPKCTPTTAITGRSEIMSLCYMMLTSMRGRCIYDHWYSCCKALGVGYQDASLA